MPRGLTHIHTYVKYKKKPGYFRCNHPDCTTIVDKEFILGKRSLCNICGAEFILDREALRRAAPRCLACSKTERGIAFKNAQSVVLDVFNKLEDKEDNVA